MSNGETDYLSATCRHALNARIDEDEYMLYINEAIKILERQIARNAKPEDPSEYTFSLLYASASGYNWVVFVEVVHVETTSYYIRYDAELMQTTVTRLKQIDHQTLSGG